MLRKGNSGSFAKWQINTAWLSSEFGENYARRIFGNEAINNLPRYKKGKYKGKLKYMIAWKKAIKGGWQSGKGIIARNTTCQHGIIDFYSQNGKTVILGENPWN